MDADTVEQQSTAALVARLNGEPSTADLVAAALEVVQLASVPVHVGDEWLVVVPSRAIARLTAALALAEEAQP